MLLTTKKAYRIENPEKQLTVEEISGNGWCGFYDGETARKYAISGGHTYVYEVAVNGKAFFIPSVVTNLQVCLPEYRGPLYRIYLGDD